MPSQLQSVTQSLPIAEGPSGTAPSDREVFLLPADQLRGLSDSNCVLTGTLFTRPISWPPIETFHRIPPAVVIHDDNKGALHQAHPHGVVLEWILGPACDLVTRRSHDLDFERILGKEWHKLSFVHDTGQVKARWLDTTRSDGTSQRVLNLHLSSFGLNSSGPFLLERGITEIIMTSSGVVVIDHSKDQLGRLVEFQTQLKDHTIPGYRVRSPGSFVCRLIEHTLKNTVPVVDQLDASIRQLEQCVQTEPLTRRQLNVEAVKLKEAADYLIRKLSQFEDVLTALREAHGDKAPAETSVRFFDPHEDPDIAIQASRNSLSNLINRAQQMFGRTRDLRPEHDRQRKVISDGLIEIFTAIVGLGTPPIVADLFCKVVIKHSEYLHAPIFIASCLFGIALVGWGRTTRWGRASFDMARLWRAED